MLRDSRYQRSFADDVAEATGLASMFADGVIDRCCKRAGIARNAMTPRDLAALMPHLESALLVYKKGGEVLAALDRLKRLAAKGQSRPSPSPRESFTAPSRATEIEHEPFTLFRRTGSG
jgi:hypothetical protein